MSESSQETTYNIDLLSGSQAAWDRSAGLRLVYGEMYHAVCRRCSEGSILEIGAGIGVGKAFIHHLVTSDVVQTPYVERAMSAYRVEPNGGQPWDNIFAIDVLHHLQRPFAFFQSAAQMLSPHGRLILVEPAATVGGGVFYSLFHHEPIQRELAVPPFEFEANGPNAEFANMGIGVSLFRDHRDLVDRKLAEVGLRCVEVKYRDVLAYPLTGGYSKPQMLPTILLRGILKFEQLLPQWLYRLIGLRLLVVLEKI
ncbi:MULTISPECIES: methyltransferase domain-containing protein [unclassified Lentimonas]|uniref:methyltransferase domain-containing protein n=1 Tax=unclassified Lentimonas TaxID=2630993 RepID=UPI001325A8DB|nr:MULTISPECIES: methyltransferase domain-containing protein [unclassified Lentimonas]CAA6691129.1 Unannotated [Lentimonas sp. CC10]CAA6693766.1 Unannotated [Lentimonas sp. CC19]CAA7070136.1 Unannotated [Lentimonas sp. CC11]